MQSNKKHSVAAYCNVVLARLSGEPKHAEAWAVIAKQLRAAARIAEKIARTAPVLPPPTKPVYVVTDYNGKVVKAGDTVRDFRGDKATFLSVTRGPAPGKSALVCVEEKAIDGMAFKRELYCGVFDLIVAPA